MERSSTSDTAKPFDVPTFIAQSMEGMQTATAAHCAAWHLDDAEQWSVDMDSGLIVFQLPGGMVATAPVQIIGTSNSEDGTFLWGWDHPSVPAELAQHAHLARVFGQAHGLQAYTTRKIACDDAQAWEFAALAMRLGALGRGAGLHKRWPAPFTQILLLAYVALAASWLFAAVVYLAR